MAIPKILDEFHTIDLESGWEVPEGYPLGMEQKILAGSLNEEAKTGSRTRLLRIGAGVFTTEPFVHEYWEEVYQLSGDLIVGNDAEGNGGESFQPNTYACRPPGAPRHPRAPDRYLNPSANAPDRADPHWHPALRTAPPIKCPA